MKFLPLCLFLGTLFSQGKSVKLNSGAKVLSLDKLNPHERKLISSMEYSTEGQYVGNLFIKGIEQPFRLIFDTGSSNLWIPSSDCKSTGCIKPSPNTGENKIQLLDLKHFPDRVTTANGYDISVQFGTGNLSGTLQTIPAMGLHEDWIVENQSICLIEKEMGKIFNLIDFGGILGLAFPSMSSQLEPPFIDNLFSTMAEDQRKFSIYVSSTEECKSAFAVGPVEHEFYEEELRYFAVMPFPVTFDYVQLMPEGKKITRKIQVEAEHYWQVKLKEIRLRYEKETFTIYSSVERKEDVGDVEGKGPAGRGPSYSGWAIFDSGTSFNTFPPQYYNLIMDTLRQNVNLQTDDYPILEYDLPEYESGEVVTYSLSPREYTSFQLAQGETFSNLQPIHPDNYAFMSLPLDKSFGDAFLLGEVFLKKYFTVYQREMPMRNIKKAVDDSLDKDVVELPPVEKPALVGVALAKVSPGGEVGEAICEEKKEVDTGISNFFRGKMKTGHNRQAVLNIFEDGQRWGGKKINYLKW